MAAAAVLGEFRSRLDALRGWLSSNPVGRSLARIMAYAIGTRLALWLLVYATVRLRSPPLTPKAELLFREYPTLAACVRWDAGWYLSIVDGGFFVLRGQASNVAFLPAFPGLVKLVSPFFPDTIVAGLVIANLATAAALVALWSWVRERAGLAAAERAVIWLLVFPFSFFFHSIYAEGLFFLACTLALRDADRGRWLNAGFWASLATLTRPMGIMLVPAFAWHLLRQWKAGRRPSLDALSVLLPALALGAYATHMWVTFGSPVTVWKAHQAGWDVSPSFSFVTYLRDTFSRMLQRDAFSAQVFDATQFLLLVPLVVLTLRAFRRLGAAAGMYAVLSAALGLVFAVDTLGREMLAVVPVFAAAGTWEPPRWLTTTLRAGLFVLLCLFAAAFVQGRFVG